MSLYTHTLPDTSSIPTCKSSRCKLVLDYPTTDVEAHSFINNGNPKTKGKSYVVSWLQNKLKAKFDNINYDIFTQVVIVKQPLHNYNDATIDGEIIIAHTNAKREMMMIYIPYKHATITNSKAAVFVNSIMSSIQSGNRKSSINVLDIVPKSKYVYYRNKTPLANFVTENIVYPATEAVTIKTADYEALPELIPEGDDEEDVEGFENTETINIQNATQSDGPYITPATEQRNADNDGKIMIKCNPLDKDGNVIPNSDAASLSASLSDYQKQKLMKTGGIISGIFIVLLVGAAGYSIYKNKKAAAPISL